MSAAAGPDIIQDGLVLCLDAGNRASYSGSGSAWTDLAGNNRHFNWYSSPSFVSQGPLSYFTTLGNRCTGPASDSFNINNTSGYTIFLICMQNSLVNTAAFKFYGSGGYGRAIFAHATWGDNRIYFDQGGCCGTDTRTSIDSGGSQTWNIWTFRRLTNSSTRTISKNGRTLVTNTATAANINLISTSVDLGGSDDYGGNSSTWNARLNSFYVYNRGLTDQEILQNYNATKGRFRLT
jgi:hypothetical protein